MSKTYEEMSLKELEEMKRQALIKEFADKEKSKNADTHSDVKLNINGDLSMNKETQDSKLVGYFSQYIESTGEEYTPYAFTNSDTGKGMTTDQLSKIFSEFYKADGSRHDFESSGLGLTIVKRIIEMHGGRIWAESEGIGKGSTFYFSLPLDRERNTASSKNQIVT